MFLRYNYYMIGFGGAKAFLRLGSLEIDKEMEMAVLCKNTQAFWCAVLHERWSLRLATF